MAGYVTVIRELQRMCDKNRCEKCPIAEHRNECLNRYTWMNNHPEEVERIVMKWAEEHPIKTNGMRFGEVFGFDLDALYSVSEDIIKWLNEEYKGGQDNGSD